MLNTFYRETASGDNVACSKYFHQDDDSRKRRSADWDLELDGDSFAYQCEMIQNDFDAGVEVGEESGECEDCCDKVCNFFFNLTPTDTLYRSFWTL